MIESFTIFTTLFFFLSFFFFIRLEVLQGWSPSRQLGSVSALGFFPQKTPPVCCKEFNRTPAWVYTHREPWEWPHQIIISYKTENSLWMLKLLYKIYTYCCIIKKASATLMHIALDHVEARKNKIIRRWIILVAYYHSVILLKKIHAGRASYLLYLQKSHVVYFWVHRDNKITVNYADCICKREDNSVPSRRDAGSSQGGKPSATSLLSIKRLFIIICRQAILEKISKGLPVQKGTACCHGSANSQCCSLPSMAPIILLGAGVWTCPSNMWSMESSTVG